MPGLRYKILCMPDMSEKKSPPRKEKPQYIKTPQSDGKGMKRKLMVSDATPEDDDKRITPKRKRALLMHDSSPEPGNAPIPRTPGSNISRITVPLSERQQMALLMRMTDGTSQGESSPKPSSPTTPVSSSKRTPGDKKVNKRNDRGETALHTAAKRGDVKQTKKLIKAGANVNIKDYAGWTPLHEACNQGMLLVAKQLLKAGANVNVQGFDDDTPLHDAAINGHPKLVELLLKHGANPLQANNKGQTALDIAASTDIEQVLRKEIISSSSDSSSIDDARSPTSPESTSSNKDEDSRPEDVQDLESHSDLGGVSSSSSSRRMLIPKSPEKTGSPRLCLKFQPTKSQYKGLPRHQSYSLTVVTNDQNTNSSPPGSPVSSIDSDLYDPQLDHSLPRKDKTVDEAATAATSWLKMAENAEKGSGAETDNRYQLKTQETTAFSPHPPHTFEDISDGEEGDSRIRNTVSKSNQIENSQHIPQDTGDPGSTRLSSDLTSQTVPPSSTSSSSTGGANSLFSTSSPSSSVSSSTERTPTHAYHNSQRRGSLGSSSLSDSVGVIHKPLTRWELHSSPKRDDSDISVPQSNKFKVFDGSETVPQAHERENVSPKVEKESIPGSPRPRSDSRGSRPSSPRTRSEHESRPLSPKSRSDRPTSPKTRSDNRETRPISPKLRSDRDSRDSRPASPKTRSELRESRESRPSSPKTRSELRDSKDGRPNSPRPRSEKGSRSSSPKVPPLKIIIPQKTAPSSSMDENCLKLLLTKPALPYVLNPTQEKEAEAALTEMCQPSLNTSRASSPASSRPSSRASAAPSEDGKREKLFREAAPKSLSDEGAKENSRDGKEGKEIKTEGVKEEEAEDKEEVKEEKEERRVTRTLRSHTAMLQQQQQKQEKTDKVDKQEKNGAPEPVSTNNSQNDNGSSNRSQKSEDMDYMSILPRKRKLRPKPELQPPSDNQQTSVPAPLPPPSTSYEKPPNPFELYLNIRKQIANRQQSLSTVHPKAPTGFKDYLMVNCTYVLQGNATSTLSVPMLSPPNSVEGPMRELFQEQEKARYNLRLQHLIEREKLMLSIEQEILREHGRAARALANQSLPLSVCTILKDEEIYNMQELEQAEDKTTRSRYNGRQFISWLQDVVDKYEKIKEYLLSRHHHEAESLFAVQKMDWEWKLKSCGLCDYNTTPTIDELHVPMVQVNDEFELLPT